MPLLAEALRAEGFVGVRTFLNSGNVLFGAPATPEEALATRIERTIAQLTGLDVDVLVRTAPHVRAITGAIPAGWANDSTMRCNVLLLWKEADDPHVLGQLPINPDVEDVRYTPGAVIWCFERVNASRTRMSKVVGTALYKQMTIRTSNTLRRIVELLAR
jgi:uncharacterized protein (DUF1697 family)